MIALHDSERSVMEILNKGDKIIIISTINLTKLSRAFITNCYARDALGTMIKFKQKCDHVPTLHTISKTQGQIKMSSSHRSALLAHNNNNRPVLICKADYGTNSSIINKYLHDKWNIEWRSTRHYRQTKFWFPEIDLYKSKQLLNLHRLDFGYTIQFLTGHGWWKQHLVTANLDNKSLCRKC